MARNGPLVVYLIAVSFVGHIHCAHYLGKFLGKLSELHHAVSGEVYAVDGRTLYIKDFTYDGQGPAAYFFASSHKTADNRGFRLRHETADGRITKRYRKEGVVVSLPEGKTLQDIKIFYVWCEEFEVNFGDVKIPRNFDFPKPQKIDPLNGVHAIASDNIVVVDAQTLLIPNLSYDGEAPDAKFWAGYGTKPSPQGIRIPDENGKEIPLRRYDRKTVVLTLPGDLTIFDIGHFGIWCEQFTVDFGHVQVPKNLNVPPSLKMLGVSPQKRLQQTYERSTDVLLSRPLVGGHLPPTTFRPPTLFAFAQRRIDDGQQQQYQVNTQPQNLIQQQQYIPLQSARSNHIFYQPQAPNSIEQQNNVIHHQSQLIPQHQQYSHQVFPVQPVAYQPLNHNERFYNQQIQYQLLQNKRLQEEQQLKAQLTRQHNRFDLLQNRNAYVPFG